MPNNDKKRAEIFYPMNTKNFNPNPKTHDSLFKWLIAAFTKDFFAHYFPDIKVGAYTFIDKEFISKYEALKESLKDDLFLIMEIEIDDELQDVVIQIEHKSKKQNVTEKMYEYACYAWLLKRKPVWSIIIYTDDTIWRKSVQDCFWFAFSSKQKRQFCHFDVIKVNTDKSMDLIKKESLMCKLLSLKADIRGSDAEKLVYEIYEFMAKHENKLSNDHKLLIIQWLHAYKNISDKSFDRIKKEVKMNFTANTITEHIHNKGIMEGEAIGIIKGEANGIIKGEASGIIKGKFEGKMEGKIEGKIEILETLHNIGILSKKKFERMVTPLRHELKHLSQSDLKLN